MNFKFIQYTTLPILMQGLLRTAETTHIHNKENDVTPKSRNSYSCLRSNKLSWRNVIKYFCDRRITRIIIIIQVLGFFPQSCNMVVTDMCEAQYISGVTLSTINPTSMTANSQVSTCTMAWLYYIKG
jgi:hypothetical protein